MIGANDITPPWKMWMNSQTVLVCIFSGPINIVVTLNIRTSRLEQIGSTYDL